MAKPFIDAILNFDKNIKILISDFDTNFSNIDIAKLCDIIIISTPIDVTISVIEQIAPFIKKNSLVTDFTSLKLREVNSMIKNFREDVEILGGHPLFGPNCDFFNQNFILTSLREKGYSKWYRFFLKKQGLNLIDMDSKVHDKNMAVIQCLTHFSNICLAKTIFDLDFDIDKAFKISTPAYLLRFYNCGRILAQDEKLYSQIQMFNPYSKKVANAYFNSAKQLNLVVKNSDFKLFEKIFLECKNFFRNFLEVSVKITNLQIFNMQLKKENKNKK